jgi:hypothetical protein
MNVLDENIPESQRTILRARRVAVRQIGMDLGRKGMEDDEVLPLLHQLERPTFFTLDEDYYERRWRHDGYCLVYLDIHREMAAEYIVRVLRHRQLNTKVKRMGLVICASPGGMRVWRILQERESRLAWH